MEESIFHFPKNASKFERIFWWVSEHNIDLAEFLVLNEEDLVEIGIDKVGVRKRLLTVIADMNKREWEKSSLPKINPRHKQSGIYISLPDAILIIGSIK